MNKEKKNGLKWLVFRLFQNAAVMETIGVSK